MQLTDDAEPEGDLQPNLDVPRQLALASRYSMQPAFIARRQFLLASGLSFLAANPVWAEDLIVAPAEPDFATWQELAEQGQTFEHWTPQEDATWKWYRLERYVDNDWKSMGISVPVNKQSGEPYTPADGYVSPDDIPAWVLKEELPKIPESLKGQMQPSQFEPHEAALRLPDPEIQARDGRPPSPWLLSLYAEELRLWLADLEATETGVGGMTCWVHLVRDHSFDPRRIEGLSEREFLLLHSAAHTGY